MSMACTPTIDIADIDVIVRPIIHSTKKNVIAPKKTADRAPCARRTDEFARSAAFAGTPVVTACELLLDESI
jgi:hypothetical protein